MKKATQETLEKRKSKAEVKKTFRVMTDSQFHRLSNRKNIRQEFFNEACAIIPTSCFVELMESKQKKYTPSQNSNIPILFDLAASFEDSCDPELDLEMLNEMFTDSIIYSDKQIQNIYEITKKQSDSQYWRTFTLPPKNLKIVILWHIQIFFHLLWGIQLPLKYAK